MADQSIEGLADIVESAKDVQAGKMTLSDFEASSVADRKSQRNSKKAKIAASLGKCEIDKLFATSRIRIYENGYVQIGGREPEKLLSIKGEVDINSKTGLGRFVGTIVAFPLMQGTNMLGPSVRGDLMLTIQTDVDIHTIHTRTPMPEFIKSLRELDMVGNSVLTRIQGEKVDKASSKSSVSADVSEQLAKLAELKQQGLLDEAEFSAAKAKLLGLS